jgi:hypothetical protein
MALVERAVFLGAMSDGKPVSTFPDIALAGVEPS